MESSRKSSDLPHLDKNIIKGIPWAEEAREILVEHVERAFLRWCQIVLNMGENEDAISGWVKIFIETFEYTCRDLVVDMESLQSKVMENIEELLQRTQQLCGILQIEMPVVGNDLLSLYQEQQQLKKRIAEYDKIIEERHEIVKALQEKQLDLCNSLGKQPILLKDSPLPSADKIKEIKEYIDQLSDEKFERLDKFTLVKEELLAIVEELKLRPSSQFEMDVFAVNDAQFVVSDKNMELLENLRKDLHKQLKNVKDEIAHLRNTVEEYWTLLESDLKEREQFRQNHKGNSIDTLEALRVEVRRCVELKKANIKVFIDKLREELSLLWSMCHCSQTTKNEFYFFNSDCYNEDLLELHEIEVKKWKKFHEENKELLTLLEKHRRLWNKMVELEQSAATSKDRYNNRGGQLLKEEKERNKLSKQIPLMEETLISLAERYFVRHFIPFTTFGETVNEYIFNLHEDRENAKKEKLSARKLVRDQTVLTPAKSMLKLFPSSSQKTPVPSVKRKLVIPSTDDKKKPKLVLSEKKTNKIVKTAPPTIKITTASITSKRLSFERKKRIEKIRRRSAQKRKILTVAASNETLADYGDFQSELSSRGDCRSTILVEEIQPTTPITSTIVGYKTPTTSLAGPRTPRSPRTPGNGDNKLSHVKTWEKVANKKQASSVIVVLVLATLLLTALRHRQILR